jgi:hypothetical protein
MRAPFVGRTRELRCLCRHLDNGCNIVLTGSFGSGRTTLVRELAAALRPRRFVFWDGTAAQRVIRASIDESMRWGIRDGRTTREGHAVLVVDDITHVTAPRLRFFRELVRTGRCQIIVIVERSTRLEEIDRLRAVLGAAPLIHLGSLGPRMAERYFSLAALEHGLGWTVHEIRGTARSTHGHPLTMRMTLELAIGAAGPAAVAKTERPAECIRLHEKRHSHGDGVRRGRLAHRQ